MCLIEGLEVKDFSALRILMSYSLPPDQAHFGGAFYQGPRYLLDKRGTFPTGLLYIAQDYLKTYKISYQLKDTRIAPECDLKAPSLILAHTPYPEQLEAAQAARAFKMGIVTAPTGTGKSVIASLIINELKVRTLVVVPSLELKKQLTATLSDAFGKRYVGTLKDKRYIAIENVDALDCKEVLTGYDCVIIDEFHHSGAKTYQELNKKAWVNVYYKFGMTATPFRSKDYERLLLESVLSKVIYRVEYQTAVSKGYIVPLEAYYIELPNMGVDNDYNWPSVYSQLVVNNEYRNKVIAHLLKQLDGTPTLCLVKEVNHGKNISQFTNHDNFITGSDEDSRGLIADFNKGHITSLIGTNGMLGEGIDSRPAEYVIIAGLGKSKNQFMQQVGRAFRVYPGKSSCKVIIFSDKSHKWSIAHFKAQVKYLKEEYNCIPARLDIILDC